MLAEQTSQGPTRYHPRVDANFMVRLLTDGRSIVVKAKDLSMAGLCLVGNFAHLARRVTVAISVPGSGEVIATSTVKRQDIYHAALEFDQLDWDDLSILARYVHPRLP